MAEALSIPKIAEKIPTEAAAYEYLEELRWGDRPVCPHCGSVDEHYFLTPANGTSRKTRTGTETQRRVWKCKACRKQFSVLTGTIFHGTRISIRKWIFVIFEMCSSKNGVAAREIQRKYNLTPKSAWYMLHRIREAMKREPVAGLLSGRVVVDETYIGGLPRNRHGGTKRGGRGIQGKTDKTPVMALISRETGEIYTKVLNDVNAGNLRTVMAERLDFAATHLQTDASIHYRRFSDEFLSHEWVDHSAGEYVRGDVSTNVAENYFSQLKRSIDGTHHHVSREHLERYLGEFSFRHSTCKIPDAVRMGMLASQIVPGKRLSYRPTG
jgi:transposase-like protein